MPIRNIAKQSTSTGPPLDNSSEAAGFIYDTVDGFITYNDAGTTRKLVNTSEAQTISGAITFTGAVTTTAVGQTQRASVTLTNTNLLALRATPITVIAAPGAGFVTEVLSGLLVFDYTAAYTETDDDLQLKYTNGSGAACSVLIPGEFLESTADALHTIVPLTAVAVANAAIVIHNTGAEEFGGGNAANTVTVVVHYRIHATGL